MTILVKDINVGSSSAPKWLIVYQNELFFSANDSIHGSELWKSDGTEGGTLLVKDLPDYFLHPEELVVAGGALFFTGSDGIHGRELWAAMAGLDEAAYLPVIMKNH